MSPAPYPRLYIGLHRGPGLVGRLIRWQTRSPWSHASIYIRGAGVIEAREGRGVVQAPRHRLRPGERVDFCSAGISADQEEAVIEFARRQLGKPYDYTMVARFVTRRQATRATCGKWFCSELVYAAFHHAGVELLRDTEPWEVSPGLLARSPHLTYSHSLAQP